MDFYCYFAGGHLKGNIVAQIKEGFPGQRMIVLPFFAVDNMGGESLTNDLYIHSLGHYPNAWYHRYERPMGCAENIIIYCVKGKGWFTRGDGVRRELCENQFVVLPENVPHSYGANEEQPWSIYWVHFKGRKAALFKDVFFKPVTVSPDREVIHMFDRMCNALSESFARNSLNYANLCLGGFLGSLLYSGSGTVPKKKNDYGTSLISLATYYMQENVDKKLKLEDIAHNFGYSTSYFYRLFYSELGYSPKAYFIQLKIARACYYLQNTSLQVNQICIKLGFDDPFYFSRAFRRIMGISPREYRKSFMQVKADNRTLPQ